MFLYSALWFDSGYICMSVYRVLVCGSELQKTAEIRSCRSSMVVDFSCRGAEGNLAVQQTIVLPLLQYIDKVIDVFVQVQLVVRSCGRLSRACSSFSCLDPVVVIRVVAHMQIPLVHLPSRFSGCSTYDKVVDVCCAGPAVLECTRGGDCRSPTVAARRILDSCCMPVVCNDRCVVDDVAHFIDVGGRRCVAAATSSSCRS